MSSTSERCEPASVSWLSCLLRVGELLISRRGEPIARVLPMVPQRRRPDHAELRERMPLLRSSAADLIRAEQRAYLDISALAKWYLNEVGSELFVEFCRGSARP